MVNKELLEKRLAVIEQALAQQSANYNVLLGGKQEVQYWLAELEKDSDSLLTAKAS